MHAIVAAGVERAPVNRGHSQAIGSRAAADRAKRPAAREEEAFGHG